MEDALKLAKSTSTLETLEQSPQPPHCKLHWGWLCAGARHAALVCGASRLKRQEEKAKTPDLVSSVSRPSLATLVSPLKIDPANTQCSFGSRVGGNAG